MRSSKLVLSCLILSCSALVIASAAAWSARPTAPGASEPGAGLSVAATLASVVDTGLGPRARVSLTIVPNESDAAVTVTRVTQDEAANASLSSLGERPVLARASIAKGVRRHLLVEADLDEGLDNHLFFLVSAQGKARAEQRQVAYLLVSLDDSKRPEQVGQYIQYQGAVAQGSEP